MLANIVPERQDGDAATHDVKTQFFASVSEGLKRLSVARISYAAVVRAVHWQHAH